ncbi:MAG: aspartate carbamoyltransferase catalytic subunit [Chloroflexi bacterium]|nr:aspartate carbamoyltransferase catalytic subunit [Chloroflexota bacterium]
MTEANGHPGIARAERQAAPSPVGTGFFEPWIGRRQVLDLDDFTQAEIERAFETADHMKEILARPIPRVPTLRGRTVVNLFYEPSTRTRVSFELAAKSLGADVVNVTASGSSVEKGETLLDTVRTLRALGTDLLVIRHKDAGAPYAVARHTDLPVVNAGDGAHAHPTQALLDAYTIRERFGRVEGVRVLIVGDIAHSRVARSNAWGLTTLGAEVTFCGPPTLMPATALAVSRRGGSGQLPWPIHVELDLERAIEGVDVVMPLRVQIERQDGNRLASLREYARDYGINRARIALAAPHAIVMHPGPMNEGIEIDPDVAHGDRSVVEDQVTNGVAARMAVLYLLLAAGESTGTRDHGAETGEAEGPGHHRPGAASDAPSILDRRSVTPARERL